jgi:trans-2,3-dihydro-3-hydroxyanthranilate isomerase
VARLDYHLLDVFTDEPYAGNPLAVFVDPHAALSDAAMQRIANELNLSETVFLTTAEAGWITRIFTPKNELPFAGHPTIGSALLLAELGLAGSVDEGPLELVLHEGVGDVRVDIEVDDGRPGVAWLTTATAPQRLDAATPDALAAALGVESGGLHPELPVGAWTCGVPFTVVALRGLDELARVRLDAAAWDAGVASSAAPDLLVVTPTDDARRVWRARVFGPVAGVPEDPGTGSAAAAFAGYLVAQAGLEPAAGWTVHQGVEMRRHSVLRIRAEATGGVATRVQVGGRAVVVGGGSLVVPA